MRRQLHTVHVLAGMTRRRGWLQAGALRIPCALGRAGIGAAKREGDGRTPRGTFPIRRLWWRAEHGPRPVTALPVRMIRESDGWCDAPGDRNYNRPVRLPYPASCERMAREDELYDLVLELGWNDHPRRQGAGSAIFLHIARPGFLPTEGCVALRKSDLRKLLPLIGPETRIAIR